MKFTAADLEYLFQAIQQELTKLRWDEIFQQSLNTKGLLITFIGYAIGGIPVLLLMTSQNNKLQILVTVIASLLFSWFVMSTMYPHNILLILGAVVAVVCTAAQVESWKMIREHYAASKEKKQK